MKYKYRYSYKQYIRIFLIAIGWFVVFSAVAYVYTATMWFGSGDLFSKESIISFFSDKFLMVLVLGFIAITAFLPLIFVALLTEVEFFDRKLRVRVPRGKIMLSVWIPYTDIYAVRAVKYPIIGLYGIRIKSTVYGGNVFISRHMKDEQQFIAMLCRNVHSMRPTAVIDEELLQIAKAGTESEIN